MPPTVRAPEAVRSWVVPRTGSLAALQLDTKQASQPAPAEVQVAVKAIGLNFADIFACLGLYSATPKTPFVPGLEFAGVITAVVWYVAAKGFFRANNKQAMWYAGVFGIIGAYGGYLQGDQAETRKVGVYGIRGPFGSGMSAKTA